MGRLVGLMLAVAMVLSACSPGRTAESVSLLRSLAADKAPDGVRHQEIRFGPDGRPADLYVGPQAPRAAIVIVPGAAEAGRRDPRLVRFASDVAAARFLVMVPQLGTEHPLQVSAADARTVADAARYLTAETGAERVGLAGLSYAVGPAMLAALDADSRDRVAFVLAVGGYYDLSAGITAMTTGQWRPSPDQPWRPMDVPERAKWLFLEVNADRLEPPDSTLLRRIATRRLDDPQAETDFLGAGLDPPGRAVYDLLVNDDPERVPALIEALPESLLADIRALDLARHDLSVLQARLILLHGRDDPMIPPSESLRLAAAVPDEQASVYLIDGLRHVDLDGVGMGDAMTLLRAVYALLRERDAAPAPIVGHGSFTEAPLESRRPMDYRSAPAG